MNEKEMKLKELAKDGKFIEILSEVKSVEEAKDVFKTRGVEMSTEEIEAMRTAIRTKNYGGELAEKELEGVVGGGLFSWLFWWMDDISCSTMGRPFWTGGTCD